MLENAVQVQGSFSLIILWDLGKTARTITALVRS